MCVCVCVATDAAAPPEQLVLALKYRLILFFEWACHIKNVDILGGTPTWDLDVPVHPIGQ